MQVESASETLTYGAIASSAAITPPRSVLSANASVTPIRRTLTTLLLSLLVVLYAASFQDIPIIERKHSVLGDADAANYVLLLREFGLSRKLGDEWVAENRSLGDNAQKHKIHHVLYAITGTAIYRAARPVYDALGLPPERAVYAVNAVLAAVNIILLSMLLRGANPRANPVAPFLIFQAAALSTWVFSSIPESWPFSATLVLIFMLALQRGLRQPIVLGSLLGIVMLNNVFLAALFVLVCLHIVRGDQKTGRAMRDIALAGFAALLVWVAALFVLSAFDGSFRPDRFVQYTIWFKQFTGADLPRTDPYVWKSAGTNLFVNSVVSHQPDPAVPQEALQTTLRTSRTGAVATLLYVGLLLLAGARFLRSLWQSWQQARWQGLLHSRAIDPLVWCATMLVVTVILFYASGFLYSAVVVPALALFLCQQLDLRTGWQRVLLYGTLALIIINNAEQIAVFRQALMALS
jgi:hypothetical protein